MITAVPWLLSLVLILVALTPRSESSTSNISPELGVVADGGGQGNQWCIADEQTAADVLQVALDWACGAGGANCSMIQPNKPCYLPNTVKDHASYAFNSYWQKHKHQGGTCYFNAAAMVTDLNPSHDACQFESLP
nr:PREDICTED: glucan endo-1,3-beta-glucosidase 12-like isoform X1 [Musa acuminata subsp. malaccensis]